MGRPGIVRLIETAPNPEFAVILMHGLGADANDFVPLIPELRLANAPGVRFVFPNAPQIAVTANNGYVMRAWYDILSFEGVNRQVDEAGIEASCATVRQLIDAQNRRGIATSKIFLAGFSQGGAMTYSAGLTHPDALAGLIVMSGYLPSQRYVESHASDANRNTPIFAAQICGGSTSQAPTSLTPIWPMPICAAPISMPPKCRAPSCHRTWRLPSQPASRDSASFCL